MASFKTFIIKTHRLLGASLSLLFVLWCLSGLVLIYHQYPKYSQQEELQHRDLLPEKLPSTDSLAQILELQHLDTLPLEELTLRSGSWDAQAPYLRLYTLDGSRESRTITGDTLQSLAVDADYLTSVAGRWGKKVTHIDTLDALDQWVPFGRLREELPFYRLHLSGDEGHEVYVASRSGRVLQESTRSERFWAWCGAIPHWIYLTFIRSNQELWRWIIIVLGALGTFMTLSGFYIGIAQYRLRTKKEASKLFSPYPKRRQQWHHFFGTVSGLMLIAWTLTGLLSVIDYESTEATDYPVDKIAGYPHTLASYQTDLSALRAQEPELRQLSFESLGTIPILRAEGADKSHYYDARCVTPRLLALDSMTILRELRSVFGDRHSYTVTWLEQYDSDYIHRGHRLPLPVWRIAIDTKDHHTYYVDPSSGKAHLVADNDRIEAWMFSRLHRLSFPWLVNNPVVWTVVIWLLLGLCTITSVTGLWMTYDYLRRQRRTRRRK